jgi:hypothetical protein
MGIHICYWSLNWGRIVLQNVTLYSIQAREYVNLAVRETGK